MPEQPKAYTVTAITRMIKGALESNFGGIWIEGEISNYLHHRSGHRYFSLKDANAVIRVTIWKSAGGSLKFEPENGGKVLAYGDVAVYEKGGQYQLNCRKLVPVGMGALELAYRQLFDKLQAEGLFDDDRKKEIPRYARRIGIVTSPTGAAVRDIIQIARRRNPSVELILHPAQVQGDGAENTIAAGIRYFNTRSDIDVLIVGRGGGSIEDLWPFNTDVTVRAIAASKIPVISAVGHEVDFTLADHVADKRAATPSAGAEIAVWSQQDAAATIRSSSRRQTASMSARTRHARSQLQALLSRPVLARPMDIVYQRQQYVDSLLKQLVGAGKNSFEKHKNRLSLTLSRLEALSPLRIFARGYSVSRRLPNRTLLTSVSNVLPGDRIETLVADGSIVSFVEDVKKKKHGV